MLKKTILLVLALFLFLGGISTLTKKAKKAKNTKKEEINLYEDKNSYYDFDLEGEKFLAKLDEKLFLAENHAISYIKNKSYLRDDKQTFSENEIAKEFSKKYYANCVQLLTDLKEEYGDFEIKEQKAKDYRDYDFLTVNLKINLDEHKNESLKIKLKVYSKLYEIHNEGKLINASRIKLKRYKIENWQKI